MICLFSFNWFVWLLEEYVMEILLNSDDTLLFSSFGSIDVSSHDAINNITIIKNFIIFKFMDWNWGLLGLFVLKRDSIRRMNFIVCWFIDFEKSPCCCDWLNVFLPVVKMIWIYEMHIVIRHNLIQCLNWLDGIDWFSFYCKLLCILHCLFRRVDFLYFEGWHLMKKICLTLNHRLWKGKHFQIQIPDSFCMLQFCYR